MMKLASHGEKENHHQPTTGPLGSPVPQTRTAPHRDATSGEEDKKKSASKSACQRDAFCPGRHARSPVRTHNTDRAARRGTRCLPTNLPEDHTPPLHAAASGTARQLRSCKHHHYILLPPCKIFVTICFFTTFDHSFYLQNYASVIYFVCYIVLDGSISGGNQPLRENYGNFNPSHVMLIQRSAEVGGVICKIHGRWEG
jgi:hypothetical protein